MPHSDKYVAYATCCHSRYLPQLQPQLHLHRTLLQLLLPHLQPQLRLRHTLLQLLLPHLQLQHRLRRMLLLPPRRHLCSRRSSGRPGGGRGVREQGVPPGRLEAHAPGAESLPDIHPMLPPAPPRPTPPPALWVTWVMGIRVRIHAILGGVIQDRGIRIPEPPIHRALGQGHRVISRARCDGLQLLPAVAAWFPAAAVAVAAAAAAAAGSRG